MKTSKWKSLNFQDIQVSLSLSEIYSMRLNTVMAQPKWVGWYDRDDDDNHKEEDSSWDLGKKMTLVDDYTSEFWNSLWL